MEWANIIGSILMALAFAVGIPLALKKRKQDAPRKIEELMGHLHGMGVEASLLGSTTDQKKEGVPQIRGQKSEGLIDIREKNIDCISIISVASQYGVNFYLDFLVKRPDWLGQRQRKKARMTTKKNSVIRGKIVDIEWKGDDYLSQTLNYDYQLKDRLLLVEPAELKGSIQIYPEAKYVYSRIRTAYLLPSVDLFAAIDMIAKHIKVGW